MGLLYSVPFSKVTISAAQDLFEIIPAANKPVKLHSLYLSNVGGTADAGDAQEELLPLLVIRAHATSGSGGSSVTPTPVDPTHGTAASFSAEVNNTTIASTGSPINCHADGINSRLPAPIVWTDQTRPICTTTEVRIVVRLVDAPADAVVMSGTLYVEELSILNV